MSAFTCSQFVGACTTWCLTFIKAKVAKSLVSISVLLVHLFTFSVPSSANAHSDADLPRHISILPPLFVFSSGVVVRVHNHAESFHIFHQHTSLFEHVPQGFQYCIRSLLSDPPKVLYILSAMTSDSNGIFCFFHMIEANLVVFVQKLPHDLSPFLLNQNNRLMMFVSQPLILCKVC